MRFDPVYFIGLCQKSGITLTKESHLIHYNCRRKRLYGAELFIATIRRHKQELMPLLAEKREVIQLDIFEDSQ